MILIVEILVTVVQISVITEHKGEVMPFKISGIELVRRLRSRVPEYKSMAEYCTRHAEDIRKKLNDISEVTGQTKMQILPMPDPDQVWLSRAESCTVRANDLVWLSDSIVEDQIHEITGEEMLNLGIIGIIGTADLIGDESE